MVWLILAAAFLGAGTAWADEAKPPAAPEYVPVVVDAAAFAALKQYLGEQPAKFSLPVMNWLDGAEAKAKEAWVAEHAPKAAEEKKP